MTEEQVNKIIEVLIQIKECLLEIAQNTQDIAFSLEEQKDNDEEN